MEKIIKERQNVFLEHGMNYIFVMTGDIANFYVTRHFKTRRAAVLFNNREYSGLGEVMTVRQAVKKYDFLYID